MSKFPSDLFERFSSQGVKISISENGIKISAPKGILTSDLLSELERSKAALHRLLVTSIPFEDRPQSFRANLKLSLWEKYGSRLFLDDVFGDLLQTWAYASQAVGWWLGV